MTRSRRPFRFVSLGLAAIAFCGIALIALNSGSIDPFRAFAAPEASEIKSSPTDDDLARPTATNGKILFESNRIGGGRKLFTMNPDGSGVTCLMCAGASDPSGTGSTDPFEGYSGAFSPDGTKIAFSRNDGQIWIMDANGDNKASTGIVGFGPDWSPDGTKLVFVREVPGPFFDREIFIANLNGSNAVNISNNPGTSNSTANDLWPEWGAAVPGFPDGRIAYRSTRTGNSDIFVASGSPPYATTNMTNFSTFEDSPTWSPDGTKIAFDSSRDGNNGFNEIWVLTPATPPPPSSSWSRMTNDPDNDSDPTWSPDGTLIAYQSYGGDSAGYDIKSIPSAAPLATPTKITNALFPQEYEPDWAPATAPAAVADLSIDAMTSEPSLVAVGSNFHINFTLRNLGPAAATGVKIIFDSIPTNVRPFLIEGGCTLPADRKLTCNVANIAAGATTTYSVAFEALQSGTVNARATISSNETDPVTANNSHTATTTIVPPEADLNVTLTSFSTETPSVGRMMSYNVRLKNNGPLASEATVLRIRVPTNARLVAEVTGCPRSSSGRTASCNLGSLASGAIRLFSVQIEPLRAELMTISADVVSSSSPPDSTPADRKAERELPVSDSPRPPNNDFANAQIVTGEHATVTGSNVNANTEPTNYTFDPTGEFYHAKSVAGKSVWYLWQAPTRAGQVKISTAGSTFDTLLDVYEFTSAPLPVVAWNDDDGSLKTSAVSFKYKPGVVYYIAVDGYNGASGDITLKIDVSFFLILSNRVDQRITGFTPPTACSTVSNLDDFFCRPEREPGTGFLILTIRGENFVQGRSEVLIDGRPPQGFDLNGNPASGATTFVNSTELRVRVPPNPPLLFARVAEAGVVTSVDITSADPARPSETVRAVAGQIANIRIIDLQNARLAPGESRRICGAVDANNPTVQTCIDMLNTTSSPLDVSPTWFAANVYCDQVERLLDRQLQCSDTLTNGGAWTVNPRQGGIPSSITFNPTLAVPPGTAPPPGTPQLLAMGAGVPLVGNDGSTLVGLDGGTLVGNDGSTLVGNDGSTLVGLDGSTLVGNDGSTLIGLDGSTLVGLDGGTMIGDAGSTLTDIFGPDSFRGEGQTGQTPARPPLPRSPGDLVTGSTGYTVIKGSGGAQPAVTFTSDEVTQKAYLSVSLTLDQTSSPKVSNIGNMVFTVGMNPGALKLQSTAVTVNENAGFAAITVQRSGDTTGPASFEYTTHQESLVTTCSPSAATTGKASEKCDFAITLGAIRFAANETTKEIRIPIVDDTFAEGTESFKLLIGNALGAAVELPSAATITITDNDTASGPENPLDTANAQFFVRQQYLDLLGREPSATELTAGTGPIAACGNDAACRKAKTVDLSNTLFTQSQQAAAYLFRLYRAAFGNTQPFPIADTSNPTEAKKRPGYAALSRDLPLLPDGQTLAQKQLELANSFVMRKAFCEKYSLKTLTTGEKFVDAVLATILADTGVNLASQRTALIAAYDQPGGNMLAGRGAVMYRLAQSAQSNPVNNTPFITAEDNRAFATMLYIGYLKRDGDVAGLNSIVTQMQAGAERRSFIDQFTNRAEYRRRFGLSADVLIAVSGRVLTPTGQALRNAVVSLVTPQGARQTATTSSFGVFSFPNVPDGATYTVTVASKRYRFSPRIVQVNGNLALGDLVGLE